MLQPADLLAHALDDFRMAMADADGDDAGERVEIPPARLVPHVLHVAFDDHQRLAVVRDHAGRQILMPQREHFLARGAVVRCRLCGRRSATKDGVQLSLEKLPSVCDEVVNLLDFTI